jgi:hypothetical protein
MANRKTKCKQVQHCSYRLWEKKLEKKKSFNATTEGYTLTLAFYDAIGDADMFGNPETILKVTN